MAGLLTVKDEMGLARAHVQAALATMTHRGPDGQGLEAFENRGITTVLGHNRLAIIDPRNGHQPMLTPQRDLAVIFNGCIYNYIELRQELVSKGYSLRTHSDTEVLLYAYREWGADCLRKLRGMFAFVIWDDKKQEAFLARDRIGIKPLYYWATADRVVFASEIKAIMATGAVPRAPDAEGVSDYMTFQFCLSAKTLFKGVRKLEPGTYAYAKLIDGALQLQVREYWDLEFTNDVVHDERYFVDELAFHLEDAIRVHLRSDVPLGAHLSGGLDSTTVAAFAARMLDQIRLRTFTGYFSEHSEYDESPYARAAAAEIGTEYEQIRIPTEEFSETLPKLIRYMDEPTAGPGLLPQYYVSKLASRHVKVVLGGQGGDELFIGYARYLVCYLEYCLRGAITESSANAQYVATLQSIAPNLAVLQGYVPMLKGFWRTGLFGEADERYFRLVDRSAGTENLIRPEAKADGYSAYEAFRSVFNKKPLGSLVNKMTYFDLKTSLQGLLQVEDRTSMAASIESRVPLLDHKLIELMSRIPPNIKFSNGRLKHLFREAIKNHIPSSVMQRTDKKGFPVPLKEWYDADGREFVHDVLTSKRARERGIYNLPAVRQVLESESVFGRTVWGLLCFELWCQEFMDAPATR